MKFLTWILLVAYFASTDSAPTTEQPANNLNYTYEINVGIAIILRNKIPYRNISKQDFYGEKEFYNHTINGILYNVTVYYEESWSLKFELPSHENDFYKASGQLPTLFLEGYTRDSNQYIVTDKITVDYVIKVTPQDEVDIDYPNFNLDTIHLHLSNNYQYKPNEEIQIKKEIQTLIMEILHKGNAEIKKLDLGNEINHSFWLNNLSLTHNKQEHYYFIDTILSTNYTLNNVTINGLWNVLSISMNQFNLSAYPEIEMSGVRGSMVQNFPSKSEELSFKADKIYISVDQNISKVNVNVEANSVLNSKLNTSLPDDQSKRIISEIELVFAASVENVWKKL